MIATVPSAPARTRGAAASSSTPRDANTHPLAPIAAHIIASEITRARRGIVAAGSRYLA